MKKMGPGMGVMSFAKSKAKTLSEIADILPKGSFHGIHLIAVVGLSAGPKDFATIQQQGWTLVFLGAIVTIIPIVAAQVFGAYVLRGDLKNSQLLAGSIAGGRSCTPALGSVRPSMP